MTGLSLQSAEAAFWLYTGKGGAKMQGEKAGLREKISFGTGAVVYCVEMILVLTYLMLFCSDVLRINVAVIGAVMSAVKIIDAVSDLVITNLADRTQTRWGKYRVWILNGIPLAAVLVFLFWAPGFLQGDTAKVLWVCVLYLILVPVLETAVTCPYMAMISTVSEDTEDRLDLSNARALGEAAAQIIVSLLVMPVILYFGDYKNVTGWRVMAVVIAGIILLCTVICFAGTKERVIISYRKAEGGQMNWREKCGPLKDNSPFWKLIGIIVFFMAHFYASSTLFTYFCIHTLQHSEWISHLLTTGFAAQILITFCLFYLGRHVEKRTLLLGGITVLLLADGILLGAQGFAMAAVYQILLGIGNGIMNSIAFAMLPDVTEYTEWKTGIALPGMISAVATFAMKMGGAISVFLASRILVVAGYDETAAVQSSFTCNILRFSLPVLSAVCLGVVLILTIRTKELSGASLEKYRKELDERVSVC